jgi:hypothetical protein
VLARRSRRGFNLDSAAIGGKKKETKGKKARKGKGKSDGHDEGVAGADAERFEVSI